MPALLTRSYLRRRFWLAGLTISLCVAISLIAGWHVLTSFHAHGHYSKLFTDLIQATSRLESEMSSPESPGDEVPPNERLKDALGSLTGLYAMLRHVGGTDDASTSGEWQAIEKQLRTDPRLLSEQYHLHNDPMPARLHSVWEAKDASGNSLESAIGELVVFGHRLAAIENRSSPRYHATANYVRHHIHEKIWPIFHRALDAIGKSTKDTARLGFTLLAACALGVFAVVTLNAIFIFIPMVGTVLSNQQELMQERDRAIASEKAKRDFLAMMSHELRTPMNGVLGFTNMLLSSELPPKQKEYAETIQSSGLTLLDLLNDILDISNIETGRLELETSNFSLEEVVGEVTALLGPQAFAKRLDISAYVDPSLPEKVAGDVGRLRQVLLKLASNAIKFTQHGGIAIECRYAGTHDEGDHEVRFIVTDTGIGIPPDHIASVFEHFTQVDSSNQRKYEGAGLGLPICKQLVELMGGEIGVDSAVDQGSSFWFLIRLRDAVPPAERIRDSMDADLTGRRCLVVDDNALNRRLVRMQLEGFGAEVDGAPDAQTAMAALAEAHRDGRPYDVAIIDHMMPGAGGLELRRMIREQPQYSGLKLILSSSGGIAFDQQARALGFDAACPKPVVQEKLVMQVHELMQQPAAPSPAVAPLTQPEPVAAQVPEQTRHRKPRLLVAEDNPINQRLIMTALKQAGYVVDMVADGVEAVHAVQRLPYDLILMDIRMPVMNGVEATQRIRSMSGPAAQRPIIAMTANTMVGDREEYLEAGMNDYVAKPIDFHVLLRKIESHIADGESAGVIPEEEVVRTVPGSGKRA